MMPYNRGQQFGGTVASYGLGIASSANETFFSTCSGLIYRLIVDTSSYHNCSKHPTCPAHLPPTHPSQATHCQYYCSVLNSADPCAQTQIYYTWENICYHIAIAKAHHPVAI